MKLPELDDSTSSSFTALEDSSQLDKDFKHIFKTSPTICPHEHNLSTIVDEEDSTESFETAQEHDYFTPTTSNKEEPTLNNISHQITGSNNKTHNEKVEDRYLTSSEKEGNNSVLHELLCLTHSSNGEGGSREPSGNNCSSPTLHREGGTSEPLGGDSASNESTSAHDGTQELHSKPVNKDFQENFHSSTLHASIIIPPLMTEELFCDNLRLISTKYSAPAKDS